MMNFFIYCATPVRRASLTVSCTRRFIVWPCHLVCCFVILPDEAQKKKRKKPYPVVMEILSVF